DKLVALNSPLVEINGEWVELRPQDIKTAQTFFTTRKDQMALSLEDALRFSTGDTQVIEKLPVVSFEASGALQELIGALNNNQAIAPLPTPAGFKGQLRPYQERGAAWLSFLERWGLGACLADDMGLGKTIQFIAFLLHLKEQDALENPTLLVCPTSVLGNWEREVNKFAPSLKVLQYHGDKRPKGKAFLEAVKKHDLIVTSYSLLHRDIKALQSVSWQIIVLDEAQNVKNPEAKQSKAVRELEATFRIALTGTPVENRLQELWSILDFLNPGYLGNKQFFQRRFAMPIEKYGDTASLTQLRSLVQPFILRRLKSDRDIIQDLPDKQEMTVFCGLTGEQAALYQQIVEQSLVEIESAEGLQRRGMILALLIKLKQICNHPAQYLKQATLEQHNSAKLLRLEEMLEEVLAEGDRALIFTQFAEWGKLLKPYLEKQLGREIFFLYGSTSKKQREEMIDRFQHDPQGPPIMILSLKAGGVGLNLTRANHVFHFDRWWNPAVENQATD
ncbi:MAG: DEAD/DEAH box helicase, partial [Tolypothrix sp. T3-bin4]|nr:DEAD/DEAH box helicase [Tolypothrix sp. T3-bin4]